MKLRSVYKWASFKMTPAKWVEATKLYNSEALKQLQVSDQSHSYVHKNPRALMTQLGTVETTISERIIAGNYKCEHSCLWNWLRISHLFNSCERYRNILEGALSCSAAHERRTA